MRQSSTWTWKLHRAAPALCIETEKALAFFQLRTLIHGHYHHCLTRSSSLLPLGFSHSGLLALRSSRPSAPLAESLSPASQDSFSFWTVLRLVLHSFPLLVKRGCLARTTYLSPQGPGLSWVTGQRFGWPTRPMAKTEDGDCN